MIVAEDLTKHFDDFIAVDGVSMHVESGQVMAVLGPNGAGKTTTVRMLTSILCPTRGRAWVAGFDVLNEPEKVRASVGVLTEHHGLYGRMNADEYLEFYARLYGVSRADMIQRRDLLLERFGLTSARHKRLGEYSKGMRQKLALVRAMIHNPPVLLLDEPTSAMDPESAHTVRESIQSLRSADRTIILCTHNLAEAEELADQVAIIRSGKILMNGTPEELKQTLLGTAEYEAELATPVQDWDGFFSRLGALPPGVSMASHDEQSVRFKISDPTGVNPELIRHLLEMGLNLVSFHAVPRSLEQAYLRAVAQVGE
jgi:ABC-2 type transport system ATP-binding protein